MKIIVRLLLVAPFVFTSCKKELEPQDSSPTTETAATTPQTPAAPQPGTPATAQTVTPGQTPQNVSMQMPNQASPAPVPVAKGMNPAHGQPGHRCDIPVGAPLNSPPGKPAQPTQPAAAQGQQPTSEQIQQMQKQLQAQNPNMTVTPAKMGADGKLLPTTPASSTPAILDPGSATAAGMNPAHGQPGHRCDIAVGAPLPK